jgi:hypothetical protein
MSDKHLGCYGPPPLKESRPEIQNGRSLRKRDMLSSSNIRYSIQLQSFNIGEQFGQRHFLILTLHGKICLKNFLHWLPWSIVTLGGIQDSTVRHSHCTEIIWSKSEPLTSIRFFNGHNIGHMNPTLDWNYQKYTHWNDPMFPPFEK